MNTLLKELPGGSQLSTYSAPVAVSGDLLHYLKLESHAMLEGKITCERTWMNYFIPELKRFGVARDQHSCRFSAWRNN
jgi:hypothetical protein